MKRTVFAVMLVSMGMAMPATLVAAPEEEAKTESSQQIVLNSFKDNWAISLEGGADFGLGRLTAMPVLGNVLLPFLVSMPRNGSLRLSDCAWVPIITV